MLNIVRCRTASLGGHEEECDNCGERHYSYNSCGDRHCPKCQLNKQINWVERISKETLPVKHYHIIFTVPHSLNKIALWNDKMYYSVLFKAVWMTLRSFGYTHYGVESGAIAVLHTWGQNLSLHPHIHCLVPAAGYSLKGVWKNIGKDDKFIYPVRQLSSAFKGKFLDLLKRALRKSGHLQGFIPYIQKAYNSKWVVYSEAPMSGKTQIIKYLGQYTHRIAISNDRILQIGKEEVVFQTKDYRDNGTVKKIRMQGEEFLRRFMQHILPKGFIRIRRYGIYHHTVKKNLDLQFTVEDSGFYELLEKTSQEQEELQEQRGESTKNQDDFLEDRTRVCPYCKKGHMKRIRELPRIRSPGKDVQEILKTYLR